jgi:hypothetical protein
MDKQFFLGGRVITLAGSLPSPGHYPRRVITG